MELGFSLRRGSVGEPGRGSFTGFSEREMKEGSGNRASIPMGTLRGKPGGRALLLGTMKDT